MASSCCAVTEGQFDARHAARDLERYQKAGPDDTTRILLDAVRASGLQRATLLDVGSGIGVVPRELLGDVVASATLVEASSAYLRVARDEACRAGHHALAFVHGDFVEIAPTLPSADVVTLDRVVCCYPDGERLVDAAVAKARRLYLMSYPRDRWYVRAVVALQNFGRWLRGSGFRTFVHPVERMHARVAAAGLQHVATSGTIVWQVAAYRRAGG